MITELSSGTSATCYGIRVKADLIGILAVVPCSRNGYQMRMVHYYFDFYMSLQLSIRQSNCFTEMVV